MFLNATSTVGVASLSSLILLFRLGLGSQGNMTPRASLLDQDLWKHDTSCTVNHRN